MRFVQLPHMANPMNVDTIVEVRTTKGGWTWSSWASDYRKPQPSKVYKRGLPWRPTLWRWHGGRYYVQPRITIYLTGDDERYLNVKPNQVEPWAEDIRKALRDLNELGVERIVAAAVQRTERDRGRNGGQADVRMTYTLPSPARHHHVIQAMPLGDPVRWAGMEQGFLTSTGRFVPRKEAMGIAVAAGQVSPSKVQSPDLFSEDLW